MYLPEFLAIWNLQIEMHLLGTWLFSMSIFSRSPPVYAMFGPTKRALVNVKNFHQLAS